MKRNRRSPRLTPMPLFKSFLSPCRALVSLCSFSTTSLAGQFVLFDVTFPFTQEDANNAKPSKSHYYVKGPMLNPGRPKDWTAPVDYRNGTVHIRLEVLEK